MGADHDPGALQWLVLLSFVSQGHDSRHLLLSNLMVNILIFKARCASHPTLKVLYLLCKKFPKVKHDLPRFEGNIARTEKLVFIYLHLYLLGVPAAR